MLGVTFFDEWMNESKIGWKQQILIENLAGLNRSFVRGKNWRVEEQSFQNDCKNKIIGFVTNSSALEQINRCKQAGICHRIHFVFN